MGVLVQLGGKNGLMSRKQLLRPVADASGRAFMPMRSQSCLQTQHTLFYCFHRHFALSSAAQLLFMSFRYVYRARSSGPRIRRWCARPLHATALLGTAALLVNRVPVVPSDVYRLIQGHRLIHSALFRDHYCTSGIYPQEIFTLAGFLNKPWCKLLIEVHIYTYIGQKESATRQQKIKK